MKTREVINFLVAACAAGINVILVGEPGVGKTDMVKQVAKMLKAALMISYPGTDDPTDLKGFAGLDHVTKTADFYPFGPMKRVSQWTEGLFIWFLDDFGTAVPAVQAPYGHVVLAREINGLSIPPNVSFVIATNDRSHRSGVSGILEMFKSRCVIVHVEADLQCWIDDFAIPQKLAPIIPAFLRFRDTTSDTKGHAGTEIKVFNNFKPTADMTNSPSPRGWEGVDKILQLNLPPMIELEAIRGRVGEAAGTEFFAFKDSWAQMPSLDGIILAPDTAPIPQDLAVLHAVASGLAVRATRTNFGKIIQYATRLETDANREQFGMLLMADCLKRDSMLITTKAGQALANSPYKIAKAFKDAYETRL